MIAVGIVLAVIIALLRGARLEGLYRLEIKALPLSFLAFFLRGLVRVLAVKGIDWPWLQVAA